MQAHGSCSSPRNTRFKQIMDDLQTAEISNTDRDEGIDRRKFLRRTGALVGTPVAVTARSHARVKAANDRIRIAQLGPTAESLGPDDDDVDHLMNWLNAIRGRIEPNATVSHGFSHAVACMMAVQPYWSGKKLYWNPDTVQRVEHAV